MLHLLVRPTLTLSLQPNTPIAACLNGQSSSRCLRLGCHGSNDVNFCQTNFRTTWDCFSLFNSCGHLAMAQDFRDFPATFLLRPPSTKSWATRCVRGSEARLLRSSSPIPSTRWSMPLHAVCQSCRRVPSKKSTTWLNLDPSKGLLSHK